MEKGIAKEVKRFKAVAKAAGLKITSQRLEIFKEIQGREDHPDAVAIFEALKPRIPGLSLDTVYRSLWTLADLGLISTVGPRQESQRFDPKQERHHHFLCLSCGKIVDFTSDSLNDLRLPPSLQAYGRAIEAQVEVRGYCKDCDAGAADAAHKNKRPAG